MADDDNITHSRSKWLASLDVEHTKDESGNDRWFIVDHQGNWYGEPFATRGSALAAIEHLRRQL